MSCRVTNRNVQKNINNKCWKDTRNKWEVKKKKRNTKLLQEVTKKLQYKMFPGGVTHIYNYLSGPADAA